MGVTRPDVAGLPVVEAPDRCASRTGDRRVPASRGTRTSGLRTGFSAGNPRHASLTLSDVNVQMPSSSLPDATAACVPAREGRRFTVLLSPTLRGARLARRLTERQLADWQYPSESAEHIVAELVANAVQHGRVPGRDFRLTLALDTQGALRIEVTDLRAERIPRIPAASAPEQEVIAEGGRGLLIVDALADRWGVDITAEPPARKVVWATLTPAADQ